METVEFVGVPQKKKILQFRERLKEKLPPVVATEEMVNRATMIVFKFHRLQRLPTRPFLEESLVFVESLAWLVSPGLFLPQFAVR